MSIYLTLVPDQRCMSGQMLAYTRLQLSLQDYELFDRMRAEATPLADGLMWYDDEGLQECFDDPYGNPLTFLSAHAVARHIANVEMRGWDTAVQAFINALPPATKVALWFS